MTVKGVAVRWDGRIQFFVYSDKYPDRLYFDFSGGPNYIDVDPDNLEVIKEYPVVLRGGLVDRDALALAFLLDFPIVPRLAPSCWIAPDGQCFGCLEAEHESIAGAVMARYYGELGESEDLDARGWVRVSAGVCSSITLIAEYVITPTQAQIDTVYDILTRFTLEPAVKRALDTTLRILQKYHR